MKTCALYARVSMREKQENENQLRQLRAFAVAAGWTIVHEYTDEDTGRKANRAAFRQLFEDASRRKFEIVLFWSLDRFSREGALETLQHLRVLTEYGVNFRSFSQQYIDSCGMFREPIIAILAAVAKQEAITISERTKAGLERARNRGIRLGRPARPYNAKLFARRVAAGDSLDKLALKFRVSPTTAARLKRKLLSAVMEHPVQNGPSRRLKAPRPGDRGRSKRPAQERRA